MVTKAMLPSMMRGSVWGGLPPHARHLWPPRRVFLPGCRKSYFPPFPPPPPRFPPPRVPSPSPQCADGAVTHPN